MMVLEEQKLMEMINRRQKNWVWHILKGNSMLKEVLEGQLEREKTQRKKDVDVICSP